MPQLRFDFVVDYILDAGVSVVIVIISDAGVRIAVGVNKISVSGFRVGYISTDCADLHLT